MSYAALLESKRLADPPDGFAVDATSPHLFAFQAEIVRWAVERGRAAVFADTGLGKAQPNDEIVLTPSGWASIDSLAVGAQVIGADGRPTDVIGVFPQGLRDIARVTFSDGAVTRCDLNHLWTVTTDQWLSRKRPWRTMSLYEIVAAGLTDPGLPRLRWRIPMMAPLQSPERELPIDPYVLGVLLGDGNLSERSVTFTNVDQEIVSAVTGGLAPPLRVVVEDRAQRGRRAPTYRISIPRAGTRHRNPLMIALRDLDLLSKLAHEKSIPGVYQLASITQRIELLRGLMDTDGYISMDGCVQFGSSSAQLAADMTELVRGLGGIAKRTLKIPTYTHRGERRSGRPHHILTLRLPEWLIPFRLPRKAARIPDEQKYAPARKIASVEMEGPAPARCIRVAAPDQLYVSAGHAVTHNTRVQLAWAEHVAHQTGGRVLIVAPLGVGAQTVAEAARTGTPAARARTGPTSEPIDVTNYQRLHHFDPAAYTALVIDESSILRDFSGKVRKQIQAWADRVPYRLACTATPAPNDLLELTNHSEFVGALRGVEMLSLFFTVDKGFSNGKQSYRLKGHAERAFYEWMASWAVALRVPSDLGEFPDDGYLLPPLNVHSITVDARTDPGERLFAVQASTMTERRQARSASIADRVGRVAELVAAEPSEPWIVWCDLNAEADALRRAIPDAVEIRGPDSIEDKEARLESFAAGETRVLISKPSICGHGLNWQHCARVAFVGMSDSWEQRHQAIRRCWRFGQRRPVEVWTATAEDEDAVVANVARKGRQAERMMDAMADASRNVHAAAGDEMEYEPEREMRVPAWLAT